MRKLKCDLCNEIAYGETFEDWMKALMPHYVKAHSDFIKEKEKESKGKQKKEMNKWIKENKKRFNST